MTLVVPHSHHHEAKSQSRLFKKHFISCKRWGVTKKSSAYVNTMNHGNAFHLEIPKSLIYYSNILSRMTSRFTSN